MTVFVYLQIVCMHIMVWVWSVFVYMHVPDKSVKSDLGVDICVKLGILKLPEITAGYYQCSANRRQFAFG